MLKTMRTIIKAGEARYLSEIKEFKMGLPHGILLKKATDVGGTFATLKCESNYIIICPFKDLVDSIIGDKNSPYKVFGKYKGLGSVDEFKAYINETKSIKIAVTYDSFPVVINMIERYSDISTFKVLVDEYHLILEDLGFRSRAILDLIHNLNKFNHYTFMSATPINDLFVPECIAKLPITEIEWSNRKYIKPRRIKTANVYKTTINLVDTFNKGLNVEVNNESVKVEELYIFMNSVQGIKQIIDNCNLTNDDVKVVCAERLRNGLTLKDIDISKSSAPNKRINFFTKKCFQGCNLFSNNGLVVVVSDSSKTHTLVDIETTMYQIIGRLRTNKEYDNILKEKVWHIYSTRGKDSVKTDEEFESDLNDIKKETANIMGIVNRATDEEKESLMKRMDIENLVCSFEDNKLVYCELKEKYLRYNHNIVNKVYKDGTSIYNSYKNSGYVDSKQEYDGGDNAIIKSITTIGFKELLTMYVNIRNSNKMDFMQLYLEEEYPLFRKAYDLLGSTGINTARFVESKIIKSINDIEIKDTIFKMLYNRIENGFISSKDLKVKLNEISNLLNGSGKLKAKDILECNFIEVRNNKEISKWLNDKSVKGFEIIKLKK